MTPTIRAISWLIPIGIYPIASEAFGTARPYVMRAIAVITIATSASFWAYSWSGHEASVKNYMLWCGSREATADVLAELRHARQDPNTDREERAAIDEVVSEMEESTGQFQATQLVTAAFLHADLLHLAGNLLFLMVLGSRVNALVGHIFTPLLYLLFAAVAGAAHGIATSHGPLHPLIGASGAIMGMAGMYLVLFPIHKVHMAAWFRWGLLAGFSLSLKLFTVRGFWVVLFYIAFDVFFTVFDLKDNVAHWAHLGGFIAGVATALILLFARLINARGADIVSVTLGRYAWALVGKPSRGTERAA